MLILIGALMGLGGTIAMDVWAHILHRFAGQPLPNWAMVGRWAGHLNSTVFHDDIGAAAPVEGELRLGWIVHYAVGVIYGIIFVLLAGQGWRDTPVFLPIWLFSLATIAAGWFLLQPGLGLGWAASKTPNPWKVRAMGLLAHTVFAIGMWIVALAFG